MKLAIAVLACGLSLTACDNSQSPPATTNSTPPAAAPASATTRTSGDVTELQKTDLVVGTGATAETGDSVTVNYTGSLNNGMIFDSSLKPGRDPFEFKLGGRVIAGWNQGVVGMKVGGKRRLDIPPNLGYGADGSPPVIPPNATLHFDIELLSVNK